MVGHNIMSGIYMGTFQKKEVRKETDEESWITCWKLMKPSDRYISPS